MSSLIANNQTYEIVKQVETANFETHANFSLYNSENNDASSIMDKLFGFYVKRNFIDDTFNIAWSDVDLSSPLRLLDSHDFQASSSNKVTAGNTTGVISSHDESGATREARHFALNDIKFRDATSWSKSIVDSRIKDTHAIASVFPMFSFFNKEAHLKTKQALQIDLIHEIVFSNDPITFVRADSHDYSSYMKTNVYYSHFFVVPRNVDQYKHNITITDIYKYDDLDNRKNGNIDENSYLHEYAFNQNKYSSSSQKSQLNTYIQDGFAKDETISLSDNQALKNIYKIGSINISDQTFYNYATNKVEVGLGGDAKQGDLVPYNFNGNFDQQYNLGFIDFLKDYKISISQNFEQKVLDPYAGKVQLHITSSNVDSHLNSTKSTLTGKQLQSFRDVVKEVNFVSLEGLRRFSDEQDN